MRCEGGSPFTLTSEGVCIVLRLTPKASGNRLGPIEAGSNGQAILKAGVTAVPEGGKANQALIKLLSKTWKIPKGAFEIVKGATDRHKTILIKEAGEDVYSRLLQWRKDHG